MKADAPIELLIITGAFPLRSQSFISNKVMALAERGYQVSVSAGARGDHEIDLRRVGSTRRISVSYRVGRGGSWRRPIRLAQLIIVASCWNPRFVTRLVRLLYVRHGFSSAFLRQLYRLLPFARFSPGLIHFEWSSKAVELRELFELFTCPIIVSCRGSDVRIQPLVDPHLAEGLRWVLARADRVHCVSQAMVAAAQEFGLQPERAFVNRPAIDTTVFIPSIRQPAPQAVTRIVSTGRIHWVKGFEYALEAVRLLLDKGIPIHYTIIGDGGNDAKAPLLFAIQEMGLRAVVTLAGALSPEGVREVMGNSDVYLLPSVSEGLSNAVLEAMAMALPVVTTNVGGMTEAVRDGMEGYVVKSRDAVGISAALARLALDPGLRASMGQRGRERAVREFDVHSQIDRFVKSYEDVLVAAGPQFHRTSNG